MSSNIRYITENYEIAGSKVCWHRDLKFHYCIFLQPVPDTVCPLDSPHFSQLHIFLKIFPCSGLLDHSSLIHNLYLYLSTYIGININYELEYLLSKQKTGTFDCGTVYFLQMHNDVAHLTGIKTKAAHFCEKSWAPSLYIMVMGYDL